MSRKDGLRVYDYLQHMLDAIDRIDEYLEEVSEVAFLADRKTQDAVIRNLEIPGEAANNVERFAPEFAAAHPEIPWSDAYRLRNQVAHGYFKVDFEVVWRTILQDLPELRRQLMALPRQPTGV